MGKYFFLIIICFSTTAYGLGKKGYSRLYPSYCLLRYYDKTGVEFDGIAPDNHIRAKNTTGHYWGLQYERVTRYGLVMSAELQYGVRRYDITIHQDMSNYDPDAVNNLKGAFFADITQIGVNYLSPKIMAGYRISLKKDIAIVVKSSMALKLFYDGTSWEIKEYFFDYRLDNGFSTVSSEFANMEKRFGRDPATNERGFLGRDRFPTALYSFGFYAGIEREINKSVIKNISIGIEGSRGWSKQPVDGGMAVGSSTVSSQSMSWDNFYDRNISIGLRIAAGLWR